MNIVGFKNLCTPAYIYLLISMASIIVMAYQNVGNVNTYCIGNYSCLVTNTALVFIAKVLYIVFWTWILNLLCNNGGSGIAWFLVLIPFLLLFIFIAFLMLE